MSETPRFDALPCNHPLIEVWDACVEAGEGMSLARPDQFAEHVLQYIQEELLGDPE